MTHRPRLIVKLADMLGPTVVKMSPSIATPLQPGSPQAILQSVHPRAARPLTAAQPGDASMVTTGGNPVPGGQSDSLQQASQQPVTLPSPIKNWMAATRLPGGVPKAAQASGQAPPSPPDGQQQQQQPLQPPPGSFKPSPLLAIPRPHGLTAKWVLDNHARFVPPAPPPSQPQDIASGRQLSNQQQLQNKTGAHVPRLVAAFRRGEMIRALTRFGMGKIGAAGLSILATSQLLKEGLGYYAGLPSASMRFRAGMMQFMPQTQYPQQFDAPVQRQPTQTAQSAPAYNPRARGGYTVIQPGRAPFQTSAPGQASYESIARPEGIRTFEEWKRWRDEVRNPAILKQQHANAQAAYAREAQAARDRGETVGNNWQPRRIQHDIHGRPIAYQPATHTNTASPATTSAAPAGSRAQPAQPSAVPTTATTPNTGNVPTTNRLPTVYEENARNQPYTVQPGQAAGPTTSGTSPAAAKPPSGAPAQPTRQPTTPMTSR